ncbi:MAG TPA: response regulator [Bacteroidia bacterium]|jgi:two-component system OmpR family response regulator|nr:response regulator [Bacteroidia bacterium]
MDAKKEYSVFLVDDNKIFLSTLRNGLEGQFGSLLKISEYNTGEECLHDMDPLPDIIFLDYYLDTNENPNAMNGIKVLGAIKAISKDIVVIMLSSQDSLEVAVEAIKCGAYDYIAKSESALVRILNTVINITENINTEKVKKKYFNMNILLAVIVVAIILIDVIWYTMTH